jgi:hypothetical protein
VHYRLNPSTPLLEAFWAMPHVRICSKLLFVAAVFIVCTATRAQTTPTPAAFSASALTYLTPTISRVEGTDTDSGARYVRLSVSLAAPGTEPDLAPRFTLECREAKGKHDLFWFLSFGGVPVQPFMPPFKPTQSDHFPPNYPQVKLKMDFEGYMRTKPYTRTWEEMPSGEFRYCNASNSCPNMETARNYMSYLNALPTLRISYAKSSYGSSPEQVFQLHSLVDEANKTPLCSQ